MSTTLRADREWPGTPAGLDATVALDATELVTRVYQESRRGSSGRHATPRAVPECLLGMPDDRGSRRVALPAPLTQSAPLQRALEARASVRTYGASPIGLAQLATMLEVASVGDRQAWPADHAAGVGLQLVVVAWRVEGLEPAVWRFDPEAHALVRICDAPAPEDAPSLTLQLEFTSAPALIFITASFAAACARYGSWGHRQLLLRAGAAGQRLWLSALGVGLAGSVFAGFLPRAADRFARLDGYRQAGLLAFATGYPSHAGRVDAARQASTEMVHSERSPNDGPRMTRVPLIN